jgi:hypothetical protein
VKSADDQYVQILKNKIKKSYDVLDGILKKPSTVALVI